MKRLLFLTSFSLAIAILFCSCFYSPVTKVASVTIDDKEYKTLYLYSFKGAKPGDKYTYDPPLYVRPSSNGYVYSYEKLSPDDTIKVWTNFLFLRSDRIAFDSGTNAVVVKMIRSYPVEIQESFDTYRIKCYRCPPYSSVPYEEDICKPEVHQFEVSKDRVTVKYD